MGEKPSVAKATDVMKYLEASTPHRISLYIYFELRK